MSLTDNNFHIDDEIREIFEVLLDDYLEQVPVGKGFSLHALYEHLEVKYTTSRDGALDKLISQILDDWNWLHRAIGLHKDFILYERRRYPGKNKTINTSNGFSHRTGETWPPYVKRRPRDPKKAEESRQNVLRVLRKNRSAASTDA